MGLYEVTNGYIGESYVRCLVVAESPELDPFTGSGSTAVAALQEGCRFVGIEQDLQHAETARLRAQHALSQVTQ